MEDFRRQFLLETVETLRNLSNEWRASENLSDARRREVFRILHTVKGTAQTFGFKTSSRLAHQLETLLTNRQFSSNENYKDVFLEGIENLINSLERKHFRVSEDFEKKFSAFDVGQTTTDAEDVLVYIPQNFVSQLSVHEKKVLQSALQNEKNIFCLEIGFELNDFADGLINFRENLMSAGEIIATLPSEKFAADGKIGFQILLAGAEDFSKIEAIAEENAARIIFDSSTESVSADIKSVFAEIVKHGEATAKKFGKQIEFKTAADDAEISGKNLKIIFDALLHLIRNAVDHAIENSGSISIKLIGGENDLRLTISDDGRGIDFDKIKEKAIDRNLISADDFLTERELIDLIFAPEFSTKSEITEISGRGIGLDAVKSIIEKNGGKIRVESEKNKGATFEITLPK